jgi:hypothetical protein
MADITGGLVVGMDANRFFSPDAAHRGTANVEVI